MWDVEYSDEFEQWWSRLAEDEQVDIAATVDLLAALGPNLSFPYSSGIQNSKYPHMRELRIQHAGRPYRILYAFDPRRTAVLLTGQDKTGNKNWYEINVRLADKIYKEHLEALISEEIL